MNQLNTTDHLWTPGEVADFLGMPLSTLYHWRSHGRPAPPAIKIGRHLRYDPQVVKEWAASRQEHRGENPAGIAATAATPTAPSPKAAV